MRRATRRGWGKGRSRAAAQRRRTRKARLLGTIFGQVTAGKPWPFPRATVEWTGLSVASRVSHIRLYREGA